MHALKGFTSITIIGKRWFQTGPGNTYHSCEIYVDGKWLDYCPYTYGYGDQYIQTAHSLLQKHGIYPKSNERLKSGIGVDDYNFRRDLQNNRNKFVISVTDVSRKKDL